MHKLPYIISNWKVINPTSCSILFLQALGNDTFTLETILTQINTFQFLQEQTSIFSMTKHMAGENYVFGYCFHKPQILNILSITNV